MNELQQQLSYHIAAFYTTNSTFITPNDTWNFRYMQL